MASVAARRVRRAVRAPRLARGLVGAAACFALAEAITRLELVDPRYLPRASTVLARLVGLLGQAEFLTAVAATLQAWAIGLAIAVAVAVPTGILLGSSRRCYQATRALIEFLRPIPSVALILAISTELLAGAAGGIGSFILRASSGGGNADVVYAATAMTGLLGLVLNWAVLLIERRALAWQQQSELAR